MSLIISKKFVVESIIYMGIIKTIVIGSVIILSIEAVYFFGGKDKNQVLGEESAATQTPVQTETPSPEPTNTETPEPTETASPTATKTPTPKPTETPIPQPTFSSQEINGFIERFSAQYSVSPDILRYIAICESGFNPNAQQSGYAGLYQFGPITWKNSRKEMGEDTNTDLRYNAEEAVQTAAYNLHINNAGIWPNCIP